MRFTLRRPTRKLRAGGIEFLGIVPGEYIKWRIGFSDRVEMVISSFTTGKLRDVSMLTDTGYTILTINHSDNGPYLVTGDRSRARTYLALAHTAATSRPNLASALGMAQELTATA